MLKRFINASAYQKVKKVVVPLGIATVSVAAYQGWQLRDKYNREGKLDPPIGPTAGLEIWADKMKHAKDELLHKLESEDNMISKGIHKVKDIWEEFEKIRSGDDKAANDYFGSLNTTEETTDSTRTVRLIVIGDSLVAGVGNDDHNASPVLPHMIAQSLGKGMKTDIQWLSSGVVGGTVIDIRNKTIPIIQKRLQELHKLNNTIDDSNSSTSTNDSSTSTNDSSNYSSSNNNKVDYIVVITCGLNDWKDVFINFPTGLWPYKFRIELMKLVETIMAVCTEQGGTCRVYLPNLPFVCIQSDPKYIMGVKPLGYFVDLISYIWDSQKVHVAQANAKVIVVW